MNFLRRSAGLLADSFLFRKGKTSWAANEKNWNLPLSKAGKVLTGGYIILKDYSTGRFPPTFPDQQRAYDNEIEIRNNLPGMSSAEVKDALAGFVIVVVAADVAVQFIDGAFIELHAGLLLHPVFELDVGRAVVLDVIESGLAIEIERAEHHLVVTLAATRITGGQFAAGFQRRFLPEAGQVNNTERAGHAGTNQRHVCFVHRFESLCFAR